MKDQSIRRLWSTSPSPPNEEDARTESNERSPRLHVALLCSMRYVRDGLASAVSSHAGMEVVASLTTTTGWQAIVEQQKPHVILMSAHYSDACRLMAEIAAASVNSKVVAHGQNDDDKNELLAWALAGAHGFVAQLACDADIISVVECVARGEVRYATSSGHLVLASVIQSALTAPPRSAVEILSRRERQVFALLGEHSNKEIASRLGVEVHTVKSHVHSILAKLGVRRRRDAVRVDHRFAARPTPK